LTHPKSQLETTTPGFGFDRVDENLPPAMKTKSLSAAKLPRKGGVMQPTVSSDPTSSYVIVEF